MLNIIKTMLDIPTHDDPQDQVAARIGLALSIISFALMVPYTLLNLFMTKDSTRIVIGVSFLVLGTITYLGVKTNNHSIAGWLMIVAVWTATTFAIIFTSEDYIANYPALIMIVVLSFLLIKKKGGILFSVLSLLTIVIRSLFSILDIKTINLINNTDVSSTISAVIALIVVSSFLLMNSSILNDEFKKSNQLLDELTQNKEKYRQLVELIPYGIVETDIQGNIIYGNPSYYQLQGFDLTSDNLPKSVFDLNRKDFTTEILTKQLQHLRINRPQPKPYYSQMIKPTGEEITLKTDWGYKDQKAKDDEIKIIAVLTDVTEKLKVEAQNVKYIEELNEAQRITKIGNWEWDMIGDRIYLSDQIYQIYGFDRNIELDFNYFNQKIHPDDLDAVNKAIADAVETKMEYNIVHRVVLENEITKYVYARGHVLYAENGIPSNMIGTAQDITELKLVEIELEKRLREKNILLQEVHHRVKNNLQIILSLIDLQYESDPNNIENFIQQTKTRINSMALVHEKLYTGDSFEIIDAPSYINDLMQIIQSTVSDISSQIIFGSKIEKCNLSLNKALSIGLIINEAINNSIKHAFFQKNIGNIEVELEIEDDQCILQIRDNGVGFEMSDVKKSMGIKMMEGLATQIDANLQFSNVEGTVVKLVFSKEGISNPN